MDEPRQHDAGASLTDHVRQFRRVARLAAADPLRLLPIDALARLVSLSAPAAGLIDLAPFERLRHAVAAPPAAARRETSRTRLQPVASIGKDAGARTTAAGGIGAAPRPASETAAARTDRPEPSSTPAALQFAGEALRRDAPAATTLADRRAAVRRRTIEQESSSPTSLSPFVIQEAAAPDSRSIFRSEAREIAVAAGRRSLDAECDERRRRAARVAFERDNVTSATRAALAAAEAERATNDRVFGDDPRTAAPTDRSSATASPAAIEAPARHDMPAAVARGHSSPLAGQWPPAARTSQADAGGGPLQRAWEPAGDSEIADALFETLYRDGVDLPWP